MNNSKNSKENFSAFTEIKKVLTYNKISKMLKLEKVLFIII